MSMIWELDEASKQQAQRSIEVAREMRQPQVATGRYLLWRVFWIVIGLSAVVWKLWP